MGAVLQHRPPNQQRDDRGDPVRVVVRMRHHHANRSAHRGTLARAAPFGYGSSRQPTDQRSRAVVFTLSMARTLDSTIDPDNEWRLPGCLPDSGYCLCSAGTAMVPAREPTSGRSTDASRGRSSEAADLHTPPEPPRRRRWLERVSPIEVQ